MKLRDVQETHGARRPDPTMRYLHLTPKHTAAAIRLLERGDILETESPAAAAKAETEKPPQLGRKLRGQEW